MNEKRIRQEAEGLASAPLSIKEALGYLSDTLVTVHPIDSVSNQERIVGAIKFALWVTSRHMDKESIIYYESLYKAEFKAMLGADGVLSSENPIQIIEYIECSIFLLTEIYLKDGAMTSSQFWMNLHNADHKFVLARYAIMYCMFMSKEYTKVSDACVTSRYGVTHAMKKYISDRFNIRAMSENEKESTFITKVSDFQLNLMDKLEEGSIFV